MENRHGCRKTLSFCIFPGYKWCGPGCSGPGAPINDVDACCQRHDRCLSKGISPCQCDQAFMKCLQSKMTAETSKGRKANLMYHFIENKNIVLLLIVDDFGSICESSKIYSMISINNPGTFHWQDLISIETCSQ